MLEPAMFIGSSRGRPWASRTARRLRIPGLVLGTVLVATSAPSSCRAAADVKYDPGVTDTEIKIGMTAPFSGPLSSSSGAVKLLAKYFDMINAKGGINGRKIVSAQLDDGYSPPKTVEQTRRLVESEQVFAMIGSTGTPTNAAVQKYLNNSKVPQLYISTGASRFSDPAVFRYTFPLYPNYYTEGRIYGRYLVANVPNARVGVVYQADDSGIDRLRGLKAGLGKDAGRMIVAEQAVQVTNPTIDSQIVNLRGAGADVLVNLVTPKAAAQAIRKVAELGWKPLHIVNNVSASRKIIEVAGPDAAKGIVTGRVIIEASEGGAAADRYVSFMKTWFPEGDIEDSSYVWGYLIGQMATLALERCGDDLTRENLVKQTVSLGKVDLEMLVPGITVNYTREDYRGFHQLQMVRFDGERWVPLGQVLEDFDTSSAP